MNGRIQGVFDWSVNGGVRPWILLVLISLILFLPGQMAIPSVDRDEARFVQASKQMMESGDYIDIRFQETPRHKKPVGIYWLQTAGAQGLGFGAAAPIWVYRLPSLLGASLAVVMTFWAGLPLLGRRAAFLGAVLVAVSLLPGVEAHLAKTDAALLAVVVIAFGCLARAFLGDETPPGWRVAVLFWVAMAAGILIKGPLILLATGLAVLVLWIAKRRIAWVLGLQPLCGVPLCLILILPWFVAIYIETDGAFFSASIGKDLLGKAVSAQESHGAPPGTYLFLIGLLLWPFAPYLALGVPDIWKNRASGGISFLLAWAIPFWLVFEVFPTKLPHYVLPVVPALALLTGWVVVKGLPAAKKGWRHLVAWWFLLLSAGLPLGLIAAGIWMAGGVDAVAAAGMGAAALAALYAFVLLRRGATMASLAMVLVCSVLTMGTAFGRLLPGLEPVWISSRLVEAAAAQLACDPVELASVGYDEPSLVFLGGTGVRLTSPDAAADFLAGGGCRMVFVEAAFLDGFAAARRTLNLEIAETGIISGFNISKGRPVEMHLYQAQ